MACKHEDSSSKEISLNVITLNCWGLLFFSKHRLQRIQAIAHYLKEQKYDLVFLQELWVRSDFDLIRDATSSIYEFAHLFSTKSILGTSGLVILSKWRPSQISFMPFTVNGSPFRPWHGDWFTGKGAAYARLEIGDLRIHLFCTHMHAQYNDNEDLKDQYSIHRICQSYQLGKFVNMTRDLTSDVGKSSDLFLLAGDLNTSPEEFPFQLLESITGLHNCFNHKASSGGNSQNQADFVTCGHSNNTYTGGHFGSLEKPKNGEANFPKGKQIDFVLYKLINKRGCDRTLECHQISSSEKNFQCFAEQIQCSSKDPLTGLSFSDHQPVAVRLRISKSHYKDSSGVNHSAHFSSENFIEGDISLKSVFSDQSHKFHHDEFSNNVCAMKLQNNPYLDKALKLMKNYINENRASKQKLTYSVSVIGLALIVSIFITSVYHGFLNPIILFSCSFVVFLFVLFCLLIIEIVFRYEQHGICSIVEDINCLGSPKCWPS